MKEFLHHLFLPHISNNYRPRLLHHKTILFVTIAIFFAGFSLSAVRTTFPSVLGTYSNITSDQLLLLTNQKRQENGLPALSLNQELSQAALNKADNMFAQDYWAHNSPDGKTPWVFIKAAGYNYIYAGENLARGFTTPSDVVNAWMASPEHRQNMLSPNYSNVGYAVETGKLNGEDTVLVVEMLGSTALAAAPSNNQLASASNKAPQEPTVNSPATPSPVAKPTAAPEQQLVLDANKTPVPYVKPLVDSASFSSNIALIIVFLFILALILDMMVIERKKVVRLVGHNVDHLFFLTLLLILITLMVRGSII